MPLNQVQSYCAAVEECRGTQLYFLWIFVPRGSSNATPGYTSAGVLIPLVYLDAVVHDPGAASDEYPRARVLVYCGATACRYSCQYS